MKFKQFQFISNASITSVSIQMEQANIMKDTQQNQLSKEILDQKLLDDEIGTVTESVYISDYDNYEALPNTLREQAVLYTNNLVLDSVLSPTTYRRKKKYNILPLRKIGELQADLRKAKYKKEEILQKYDISISTLMRYIHKFNQKIRKNQEYGAKTESKPANQFSSLSLFSYRALFLKQYNASDQNRIIYIDEVYFKKKVRNHSRKALMFHSQFGFLEQVHLLLALGKTQIIHWTIKGKKANEKEFAKFLMDLFVKFRSHKFIMDNNRLHKSRGIIELIAKLNMDVLYLPPQSADFNPIKSFFTDFKRILRPRLREYNNIVGLMSQTHKLLAQIRDKAESVVCFKLKETHSLQLT